MPARNLLLILLTLICVAICIAMPFIPETVQPFDATSVPGEPALVVLPSTLGLPMAEGLKSGDKIYYADLAPRDRSYFMTGSLNSPAGAVMDLVVRRADGPHRVSVALQPVPFLNGSTSVRITEIAGYALMVLVTALGLVLLWRGQNLAATGVALWCFTQIIESFVPLLPLPLPYNLVLSRIAVTSASVITLLGLYLVALSLTADSVKRTTRRSVHWLFAGVIAVYCIGVLIFDLQFYFQGTISSGSNLVRIIHFVGFAIPLVLLLSAYGKAAAINQARIRWVLFSLLGLVAAYVLGIIPGSVSISPTVFNIIGIVLTAASFSGFAYAVLKHQLVSLQVVVNRALVYGLVTSLVVGVFAAMLSFLERTAFNSETNSVVVMVVILILGMGVDTIKKQVNNYLGKALFRKRHQAEAALAQFARTCSHVDDGEKLLDLTADELYRQSAPQTLAIYLTAPQSSGAAIVRQRGEAPSPPKLDNNDLAFLRLKAGDAEVNLAGVGSALGQDGLLYALQVRNQLLGCIYFGPRPAEAYSAEERQLFERVAHQVAVALHALRLEAQRKLLEDLADGAFGTPASVQAKVRDLIGVAG